VTTFILFPGRHHLLTRFQAEHLTKLGGTVVWAVTSANHEDTLVACSTPSVAALYSLLGFEIDEVEAAYDPALERPWDVLLRLASGDPAWRELAHPATADVFDRYQLADTGAGRVPQRQRVLLPPPRARRGGSSPTGRSTRR
jgi:hypothetical protein